MSKQWGGLKIGWRARRRGWRSVAPDDGAELTLHELAGHAKRGGVADPEGPWKAVGMGRQEPHEV